MKIEKGQVAVITGGASGIGHAIGAELSARGLNVVLADIDEAGLASAATGFGAPDRTSTFRCDVSDAASVAALRDHALGAFGQVDLVFNNAGVVLPFRPMWDYTPKEWAWLMGINLWGVIHGIQAFVPYLVERGAGHVVNTASMAGMGIVPRNGAYNAAKHAVVSLTETLALELEDAAPGVRASVLCPGLVPTRIHESAQRRPDAGSVAQDMNAARPARAEGHHVVAAEDVARRTLRAVEENRTYIFSHPGSEAFVHERMVRIERDLAARR